MYNVALACGRRGVMAGVRDHIAERLGYETKRKGLSADALAERAHLPEDVIHAYLGGKREIDFAELRPLCAALALAPMRLLAKRFDESRLAFRRVNASDLAAVGRIEEAFLLIKDHLPKPIQPRIQAPDITQEDPPYLIGTLVPAVNELRVGHPRVEHLLRWLEIPVLPVSAGPNAFDACLLSCSPRFAICINRDKPLSRIHFSLLHEIAHYLFDRQNEVPLDTDIFEFYSDRISRENRPEYIANKFAQNYLIPFEDAEEFARDQPPDQDICERLAHWRASVDVLAHAVYDQYLLKGRRSTLNAIKQDLAACTQACHFPDLADIRTLLDGESAAVADLLRRHADEYSDEVLSEIKGALGLS
jgi:Zn-dependent peptidase ImmA (M78 family)